MAQAITVLTDLPKFRGNPRRGEANFHPGINVRTFFRTLDNYFSSNRICDDAKKTQILFAQIDKEHGDAIELANCYAGRGSTYAEMQADFLDMYPNFAKTEYRHAARSVMNTKLALSEIFNGMTKLECQTRALVEAYISNPAMLNLGIVEETELDELDIRLTCILQNFAIHLFTATQLPDGVYDKIANITPDVSSTKFMSKVVQVAERARVLREDNFKMACKKKETEEEVMFPISNLESPGPSSQNRPPNFKCFRCNNPGHYARDCRAKPVCKFCKLKGHTLQECRKRLQQRANQTNPICSFCSKVGHEVANCFLKKNNSKRTYQPPRRNVRALDSDDLENPDVTEEEESSNEHLEDEA